MRRVSALLLLLLALGLAAAEPTRGSDLATPVRATLTVSPSEARVGDRLQATLVFEAPAGTELVPPELGASLGPFTVAGGAWGAPVDSDAGGKRWTWTGTIAAYETGKLEVPPIELRLEGPSGSTTIRSEPVEVTIRSVLPPDEAAGTEAPDIGDLKPPASIVPDYGPLAKALGILAFLLLLSGLAWWLHRRYAPRFAAVPAPPDPFRRMPPHQWAYEELQRLLDQRLAEEGKVELFFEELSRILKRYLGGRYRVELMEHTTEELAPLLRQAGAPANPLLATRVLLESCDRVKFARDIPAPDACRTAVEEAYRIVDTTKPAAEGAELEKGAA